MLTSVFCVGFLFNKCGIYHLLYLRDVDSMTSFSSEEKETIQNVKYFFKNEYDRYLTKAQPINSLSGMKLNSTGGVSCSPNIDAKEKLYLDIMDATKIIESVKDTINNLQNNSKNPYKRIMEWSYLKQETDIYIINNIEYERSQYFHRVKPCAILEFAEKFPTYQLINGVDEIVDLSQDKMTKVSA